MLRPVALLLIVGAVCVAIAGAQEIAQEPAPQITGRVVRADNGQAIEGASVRFVRANVVSSNGQFPTAVTDKNGEYRFHPDAEERVYLISASADGFVTEEYSSDGTLEGHFQHVDASTRKSGIDFHLKREAVIRGQLFGVDGKPAGAGISVAAARTQKLPSGTERLIAIGWIKTDADGRFAIDKLPAETYFVCVNGPNGFNAFPDAGGWYRETYFGSGDSAEGATPLALKEGEERDDVRITVTREKRYRVIVWPSGPEGEPTPQHYDVTIEGRSHSSEGGAGGSQVIPGIPPGHYKLVSMAWSDSNYMGEGDVTFDVVDSDVNLDVHVGGLGEIRGSVKSGDSPGTLPAGLMVEIDSESGSQAKHPDAAGQLYFDRVLPGQYNFKLLEQPAGMVIRGVQCGGVAVSADARLQVGEREKVGDCEVVVGQSAR
jgi:Carboxypeptidase regulatory-like domain